MEPASRQGASTALVALAVALGLGVLRFFVAGHAGLDLEDEGFLWYGALRTADGALPLVDFRSDDPGRYAWCASFVPLVGRGLVGLRLSCAAFASLGIFAGLLAASRVVERRWLLVPIGLLLSLWIQPLWSPFAPALALLGVWLGARLVEDPGRLRHVALGLWIGVAAGFGKELGLYGALSSFLIVLLVARRTRADELGGRLGALAFGTLAGYAPVLVLGLIRPDFARAVLESFQAFVEQSSAGLGSGIPWPWTLAHAGEPLATQARSLATGSAFVLVPLVLLPSLALGFLARGVDLERRALVIAAGLVGLTWAHQAAARPDLFHLAQAIPPTLLAALALPRALGMRRLDVGAGLALVPLAVISVGAAGPSAPFVRALAERGSARLAVAGDTLRVDPSMAERVEALRGVVERQVPRDEPLFVGPQRPGLYPLLGRTAPTWDSWVTRPSEADDARMLRELEGVRWALVHEARLDDDATPLDRAHPQVAWLFASEFAPVPDEELPEGWTLLRRKGVR